MIGVRPYLLLCFAKWGEIWIDELEVGYGSEVGGTFLHEFEDYAVNDAVLNHEKLISHEHGQVDAVADVN